MSTTEVRVRKSLAALEGKDERTGYFICLKMLGILPTPPGSGFERFTYNPPPVRNNQSEVYVPKCLHDVLIASHATSCEHRNFYFSYYHRHLTILTEIFLNFAHQVLKGGLTELKRIYPSPQYDQLHGGQNQGLWTAVINLYQKLQLPKEVSNHYWNPTDYKNPAELTVPVELTPNSKNVEIDALFHNINGAYPYQHNVQRRWYQDKKLEYGDISDRFNPYPAKYTPDQTKFINGELDPRKNQDLYLVDYHYIDGDGNPQTRKKFLYDFANNNRAVILNKNYNHFRKTSNYLLNSITAEEALANYGAEIKHLQYITRTEQKKLDLSDQLLENYNNALPHYQYARALFGQNMKQFMEDSYGGERSHNYMHNNLRDILNDGTYSVTSLVFWPYHGWIDAQVEIKIRRSNAAGRADYDYMATALNQQFTKAFPTNPTDISLSGVFDQFNEKIGSMANWRISGTQAIDPKSAGYYPITEWVSPGVKKTTEPLTPFDISAGCCARDLALTKTNIRDSFNFNELYRNHYALAYEDRYKFFNNLKGFNFNFDYQIGSNPNDLDRRLGKNAQNLPAYLAEMENAYFAQAQLQSNALRLSTAVALKKSAILKSVDPDFDEAESVCIRKLFTTGIELFATYSPSTPNGPNPVYLKLKNVLHELHQKLNEKQIRALERYIQNGIDVHDIFIFGKANFADTCYKCAQDKATFEDLDENFRLRNGRIWQHLHLSSLNEFYHDSKRPELKLHSIYDKLSLVPNGTFKIYRLISGAEELVINVNSNIKTNEAKFVRIDAHSYSVRQNAVKSVLSKKELTFHSKFDFYKMFDVDLNNKRNYFDRYVYKTLKGWVAVADKRAKFEFEIPNFQRLLRLNLQVDIELDKLVLKVTDADFDAKKAYYTEIVKC